MRAILTFLLSAALVQCAPAAIARVASSAATANTGGSTATSLNVVMGVTPTAGNVIVMAVASGAPITIAAGNIEWLTVQAINSSVARCGYLAVGRVFSGASATITVNTLTSVAISIAACEYSGCQPRWDRTQWAVGSSTTPASGASGTTSTANQLMVGSVGTGASGGATFSSPTNSFLIVNQDKTSLGSTSDKSVALLEKIVAATGTANAGAVASATGIWTAIAVTLEETSAGGGASPENNQGSVAALKPGGLKQMAPATVTAAHTPAIVPLIWDAPTPAPPTAPEPRAVLQRYLLFEKLGDNILADRFLLETPVISTTAEIGLPTGPHLLYVLAGYDQGNSEPSNILPVRIRPALWQHSTDLVTWHTIHTRDELEPQAGASFYRTYFPAD